MPRRPKKPSNFSSDTEQAESGHWWHEFSFATQAIKDNYRARWYETDLLKTLCATGLGPPGMCSVHPDSSRVWTVSGMCKLKTPGSRTLQKLTANFDDAALLFPKLDHSTSTLQIDELIEQLAQTPSCSVIAERLYDSQASLFVGLLKNWDKYILQQEFYEARWALKRVQQKLDRLRTHFPALRNRPMPDPFDPNRPPADD